MGRYLTEDTKIDKVADHTAAGTTVVAGTGVDLGQDGGYEGVVFITSFGTANAGNFCYGQQSSDDGSSDSYDDLTGTKVTSGTSDEDIILDIRQPQKRYVRLYAIRGSSSTLESIWAIRYGSRHRPVTSNTLSGTSIQEQWTAPSEGTA